MLEKGGLSTRSFQFLAAMFVTQANKAPARPPLSHSACSPSRGGATCAAAPRAGGRRRSGGGGGRRASDRAGQPWPSAGSSAGRSIKVTSSPVRRHRGHRSGPARLLSRLRLRRASRAGRGYSLSRPSPDWLPEGSRSQLPSVLSRHRKFGGAGGQQLEKAALGCVCLGGGTGTCWLEEVAPSPPPPFVPRDGCPIPSLWPPPPPRCKRLAPSWY